MRQVGQVGSKTLASGQTVGDAWGLVALVAKAHDVRQQQLLQIVVAQELPLHSRTSKLAGKKDVDALTKERARAAWDNRNQIQELAQE